MPGEELFDEELVAAIAASLDLREPNRKALETVAAVSGSYFDRGGKPPFEGVLQVATGVGKTYILAAGIEYFAALGVRNFAVITPGRTILEKTQGNFTPGHSKSLLGGMDVSPTVITSENFKSAAMRSAMDDPSQVKLFVFSVQSLIKPSTKAGRKTHDFNESLGEAFYEALRKAHDLVVFADEHHAYYGKAFSKAVRGLEPRNLLGLTATPHKKTTDEEIIYRYPLSAAIADELVKTPVIVGRKDDRSDPRTKLADGVALLRLKERAVNAFCERTGAEVVNPLMLVVASDIDEAEELEAVLREPGFAGGDYADAVLTVHSNKSDDALTALEDLEEPDSPYRVVVSVGMLKEGWDNKSVYVIASMRASVSTILTEQTLGRGLRLPFGAYTEIEALDTLEVLGHESYEQLLRKADILNESFIDYRTAAVMKRDATGELVPTVETSKTSVSIGTSGGEVEAGKPCISSIEEQTEATQESVDQLTQELLPKKEAPRIQVPVVKMTNPRVDFSLADITEHGAFEAAGKSIAADPEAELRRTVVSAKRDVGEDGLPTTRLVTTTAVDDVVSPASLMPSEDAREELLAHVLASPNVPARKKERAAAAPILDAFMQGLGDQAGPLLSAYMDRAAARLIRIVDQEAKRFAPKPKFDEIVELEEVGGARIARKRESENRTGKFQKGTGYGYSKSIYAQDWFDSSTERTVANMLEDSGDVEAFLRLLRNDLPIVWARDRSYNPDFVVVEKGGIHIVLEVKMEKGRTDEEVAKKREAAKRWAGHVNASGVVNETWRYVLAYESDVAEAAGTWNALKGLAE